MDSLDNPRAELEAGKSLYLLSVNLKNRYKPGHQPRLTGISIENKDDGKETVFTVPVTFAVAADRVMLWGFAKDSTDPEAGNSYLTHIVLEPGKYTLRHLYSESTGFMIWGRFITPIHEDIEVSKSGVYYLGRINAAVRKRTGNEFKAGLSTPLVDQSTVGASGGTFDVEISDQWDFDELAFTTQFPSLEGLNVTNEVLPAFDRGRAQKYWEEH